MENFNIMDQVRALLRPGCIYEEELSKAMDILTGLLPKCFACADANKCRPRTAMKIALLIQLWNAVVEPLAEDEEGKGGLMAFFVPPFPSSWKGENPCPKREV